MDKKNYQSPCTKTFIVQAHLLSVGTTQVTGTTSNVDIEWGGAGNEQSANSRGGNWLDEDE